MEISVVAYIKGSDVAVPFYMEAFGATLGYHVMNEDGTYFHAEIVKDGKTILSISESKEWNLSGKNMQFGLNFGEGKEEEVRRAYDRFKNGGEILYPIGPSDWNQCMADVIDRYGIRWYLAL